MCLVVEIFVFSVHFFQCVNFISNFRLARMQRDLQREDAYLLLAFCVSMHDKLPQRKCVLQLKTLSNTLIPIDCVIYRGVIVLASIEAESSRAYRSHCRANRAESGVGPSKSPKSKPGAILSCD